MYIRYGCNINPVVYLFVRSVCPRCCTLYVTVYIISVYTTNNVSRINNIRSYPLYMMLLNVVQQLYRIKCIIKINEYTYTFPSIRVSHRMHTKHKHWKVYTYVVEDATLVTCIHIIQPYGFILHCTCIYGTCITPVHGLCPEHLSGMNHYVTNKM